MNWQSMLGSFPPWAWWTLAAIAALVLLVALARTAWGIARAKSGNRLMWAIWGQDDDHDEDTAHQWQFGPGWAGYE